MEIPCTVEKGWKSTKLDFVKASEMCIFIQNLSIYSTKNRYKSKKLTFLNASEIWMFNKSLLVLCREKKMWF